MADELFTADALETEKIKTPVAQIIAKKSGMTDGMYYEIMYYDPKDRQIHIGYGSYNPDFVQEWLNAYFEVDREQRYSLALIPWCTDCKYKGVRRSKCSCCRRNLYIKDCYERGTQPQREDV